MNSCSKKEENRYIPKRHLPMEGGYNFRDLGGYKNTEGKTTQWGKIFRSDDLSSLVKNDLDYLSKIPLVSVVDFRSENEIQKAPDKIPDSVKGKYLYSIKPGNLDASQMLSPEMNIPIDRLMTELYGLFVTDSVIIDQYRKFFALLQDTSQIPLLFHCSAGKDRTGMAAAFILFALGVDEETVMEDYLLSNKYLEGKYVHIIAQYPQLKPAFGVKREYLEIALNQIKQDHGSIENYLQNILNVDILQFRKMYLE